MGVKQHLMTLRRVRLQNESAAGAKLQVGGENLAPDATNDQVLFAPVKLKGFAKLESERDISFDLCLPATHSPASDKLGYPTVVARKAGRF